MNVDRLIKYKVFGSHISQVWLGEPAVERICCLRLEADGEDGQDNHEGTEVVGDVSFSVEY